jgi:hypothetical protein
MGYESNGSGLFTFREGVNRNRALHQLQESFGYSYRVTDPNSLEIFFSGHKLYNDDTELQYILDNFNGEFIIYGDEDSDIWKLTFENGNVSTSEIDKILFKEPIIRKNIQSIFGIVNDTGFRRV